jgi:uncharacterized short protein YbdD (DUF466 family)
MRETETARLAGAFSRFRAAWLGVFGIPNYEAYLAHMRATHPGETPLARGEFLAWALERRHAARGPRCC